MCGILGAVRITGGISVPTIRHLFTLNEARGGMSTGCLDNNGHFFKQPVSAREYLKSDAVSRWLAARARTGALVGHTRAASRGAVSTDNAHPFCYKCLDESGGDTGHTITGVHNGSLPAPKEYDVDSQYLFHMLSKAPPGEYQKALGEIPGWYAIIWKDTRDGNIYLLNWQGTLAFNVLWNCVYLSSDESHLEIATGHKASTVTKSGDVWRFRVGEEPVKLPDFEGKVYSNARTEWQAGVNQYGGNGGASHTKTDAMPAGPDDWVESNGDLWVLCKDGVWRHEEDYEVISALVKEGLMPGEDRLKKCRKYLIHLSKQRERDEAEKELVLIPQVEKVVDDSEMAANKGDGIVRDYPAMDDELEAAAALSLAHELKREGWTDEQVDKHLKDRQRTSIGG